MPAHTQPDATLTVTVDTVDYSCQFITAGVTLPASNAADVLTVACGDDVALATTEKRTGSLRGEVLTDTSATGITRALSAMLDGQPRAYTYTLNPGAADGTTFSVSGNLTVEPFELTFAGAGATGRHQVSFVLQTAAVAAPVAAQSA